MDINRTTVNLKHVGNLLIDRDPINLVLYTMDEWRKIDEPRVPFFFFPCNPTGAASWMEDKGQRYPP
jgi:hypothetical protein